MKFAFEDKVALVTGAAMGLGLEAAKQFAQAGAAVVMADWNGSLVQAEAEKLTAQGFKALAVQCDVSDEQSVKAMVQQAMDTFGRLDFAYNNAGIQVPVAKTAEALAEDFDRAVAVNLKGIWLCMKYELQVMSNQGSGAIVNCSSQCGVVAQAGLGAYTATKHGVIGLTKAAALEYAEMGIRINAICPGVSLTPMVEQAIADYPEHMQNVINAVPLKRVAQPVEMAGTVLWLCSPASGYVVGQAIVADGGVSVA